MIRFPFTVVLLSVMLSPVAFAHGQPGETPRPSVEPQDVQQFIYDLLAAGEELSRVPCLSLTLASSDNAFDVTPYLGEQTTGLEVNSVNPTGDGVNAIVVAYPTACVAWAQALIDHDSKDTQSFLADLLT